MLITRNRAFARRAFGLACFAFLSGCAGASGDEAVEGIGGNTDADLAANASTTPLPPIAELETSTGTRVVFYQVEDSSLPGGWALEAGEFASDGQNEVLAPMMMSGASFLEAFLAIDPQGAPSDKFFEDHERHVQLTNRPNSDIRAVSVDRRYHQLPSPCRSFSAFLHWADLNGNDNAEVHEHLNTTANHSINAQLSGRYTFGYTCNRASGGSDMVKFVFRRNGQVRNAAALQDGVRYRHTFSNWAAGEFKISSSANGSRRRYMALTTWNL